MASKFGLLGKLDFLQDFASAVISRVQSPVIHNVEKYIALQKAFYFSQHEEICGDYIEFGVYTGSSFTHAMRCYNKNRHFGQGEAECRFWGFDSFEGFGELAESDQHPFFKDNNFETQYSRVEKRVNKAKRGLTAKLIKGFFSETLKDGPAALGIRKAKIIMVDCDTYVAAKDALSFCEGIIQEGTVIVLDDRIAYKGSRKKGVSLAFKEFLESTGAQVRPLCWYGVGAVAYVVAELGAGN